MARGTSLRSLAKDDRPQATLPTTRRLLGYLRPHSRSIVGALVWLLVASVTQAAQPALTGRIIDSALAARASGGSSSVLLVPVGLLLVAAFAGWWSQRMQILILGTAGQKALFTLREQVFAKVQSLSIAFFDGTESGDLMSRLVNDIETVNSFLSQGFRRVLGASLGLTATLAGMLYVDWRLALATLAIVPVMLVVTRLFGLVARRAFRRRQEAIGDVSSTLAEELAGIKVAQAFNRTEANQGLFQARNAENRDANITASAVSSAFSPALTVIGSTSTALIAGFGGWLAVRDLVTVGVVVAFFGYARAFFNAVSQLSSLYAETQSALAGGERVFGLLDTPVEIEDAPDAIVLPRVSGHVRFDGVRFAYSRGDEVLHGIDLDIAPGTTVAVVGPTGAGKTSLASLIPRFYDPGKGRVCIDDHDLRHVTLSSLRANMGIVLQEPYLFAGTISDNIRYGKLDATDRELREAALHARVLEFADRLPEGLETHIGERGVTLSTGQRQLVAFARAILGDPALLILDEATSSVDTRTEALIQAALADILAERTAIVIAHRLSTVRDADRIVVLENGFIAEDGSYAELLTSGGVFSRLHNAQFAV